LTGSPVAAVQRYEALDALRGLCAICVCLFHFKAMGPIASLPFVRGSWLFVDFFFVLSGFVIAANYRQKLTDKRFLGRFAILRFGRVWPLHMVMLLAFIGFETLGQLLSPYGVMQRQAFYGSTTVEAIFTNIAFLQAFGLHNGLTWNQPAWSVAVEFWTYLLFAALVAAAAARTERWLLAIVPVAALTLLLVTSNAINVTHDWSLLRCILGFGTGVLAWHVWERRSIQASRPQAVPAFLAEIAAFGLTVAFVVYASGAPFNLAAPLLFAAVIFVFAAEAGPVSGLLRRPLFLLLGRLSFSIYMVHTFVQARFDDALRMIGRLFGPAFLTQSSGPGQPYASQAGSTPSQGIAFTIVMLLLVVGTSWLTWRFVEQPGQRLARRAADRFAPLRPVPTF
jgi:peptidoglycan/LPS O-acetylase OafA/YrhL